MTRTNENPRTGTASAGVGSSASATVQGGKATLPQPASAGNRRAAIDLDAIPDALRGLKGWLLWRLEQKAGDAKPRKMPYYIDGTKRRGTQGSDADRAALATFDAALAALGQRSGFSGLGLAVLPDWRITAVDLDHCYDDADAPTALAQTVLDSGTYCERSPSGKGLRAFFAGRMFDAGKRKVGTVEVFCGNGFVTVTGNREACAPVIDMPPLVSDALKDAMRHVDLEHEARLLALAPVQGAEAELPEVAEALRNLSARGYDDWQQIGAALKRSYRHDPELAERARAIWKAWSAERADGATVPDDAELDRKWDEDLDTGAAHVRPMTHRTIIFRARLTGWRSEVEDVTPDERGNARWLVRYQGDRFIAVRDTGKVHVHDGRVWSPDKSESHLYGALYGLPEYWMERAQQAEARQLPDLPELCRKHAAACRKRAMLSNTFWQVGKQKELLRDAAEFDAEPHLLCVANGVLDLDTGTLHAHHPRHLMTRMLDVEYDPNADAPRWHSFLFDAFDTDLELYEYFQRVVGYAISGHTSEQLLFFLYGPTRSGKSTALRALHALFRRYAHTLNALAVLDGTSYAAGYQLADLHGVRIAEVSELPRDRAFNVALLKSITGEDELSARQIYERPVVFRPICKIFMVGNERPRVPDGEAAFWRRVVVLPFDNVVPESKVDPHLLDTLLSEEPAGILAWAVRGYAAWRAAGLQDKPEAVRAAVEDYRAEADHIAVWERECCEREPYGRAKSGALRASYTAWCATAGHMPVPEQAFWNWLAAKYEHKRSGGVRQFRGLRLK